MTGFYSFMHCLSFVLTILGGKSPRDTPQYLITSVLSVELLVPSIVEYACIFLLHAFDCLRSTVVEMYCFTQTCLCCMSAFIFI